MVHVTSGHVGQFHIRGPATENARLPTAEQLFEFGKTRTYSKSVQLTTISITMCRQFESGSLYKKFVIVTMLSSALSSSFKFIDNDVVVMV